MVIGFFLYQTFKEDTVQDILPLSSYATTVRRLLIDIAAKVVRTGARGHSESDASGHGPPETPDAMDPLPKPCPHSDSELARHADLFPNSNQTVSPTANRATIKTIAQFGFRRVCGSQWQSC
jgi:hypothetical protein